MCSAHGLLSRTIPIIASEVPVDTCTTNLTHLSDLVIGTVKSKSIIEDNYVN